MKFNELLELWKTTAGEPITAQKYAVHLPLHEAARLHALAEMFPGRSETSLITDLLAAALDEIETRLPYIAGENVIAEDEFGDPMYEDVGPTPRFAQLTHKHARRLQHELHAAEAQATPTRDKH